LFLLAGEDAGGPRTALGVAGDRDAGRTRARAARA